MGIHRDSEASDVYGAQESFVTGTFAGVAPVSEIDGRIIGNGQRGEITKRLQQLYLAYIETDCVQQEILV